ncbi:uncharacterized protein ARMOST_14096 [Armillaria ostoyae]|uniref:Uncharacterized protein n=1 Tax=Armillaria ostoyae TaxID=47428 RepID=A0A284RPN1_ARMOS|nr:uncharacterized protein ARMOST_14096 [Armillaria ostoyae]
MRISTSPCAKQAQGKSSLEVAPSFPMFLILNSRGYPSPVTFVKMFTGTYFTTEHFIYIKSLALSCCPFTNPAHQGITSNTRVTFPRYAINSHTENKRVAGNTTSDLHDKFLHAEAELFNHQALLDITSDDNFETRCRFGSPLSCLRLLRTFGGL